jgi:hypothetical protein
MMGCGMPEDDDGPFAFRRRPTREKNEKDPRMTDAHQTDDGCSPDGCLYDVRSSHVIQASTQKNVSFCVFGNHTSSSSSFSFATRHYPFCSSHC